MVSCGGIDPDQLMGVRILENLLTVVVFLTGIKETDACGDLGIGGPTVRLAFVTETVGWEQVLVGAPLLVAGIEMIDVHFRLARRSDVNERIGTSLLEIFQELRQRLSVVATCVDLFGMVLSHHAGLRGTGHMPASS